VLKHSITNYADTNLAYFSKIRNTKSSDLTAKL
jgi:hypothetical protein